MKKTVSVLLSFVMIISILTALPFTAHALPASGECGENTTYKFDSSSGTLTIGGTGEITFNSFRDKSEVKKVVINNGLLSIEDYAFSNCKSLTEIYIPSSVEYISDLAFVECSNLSKITVASKNKTYDSRKNCNAIIKKRDSTLILGCKNTKIPDGIDSIGSCAFLGCIGLKSISIPNTVTYIETSAFEGTGITNLTVPASVKDISETAFAYCANLSKITVASKNKTYDSRKNCNAIIKKRGNILFIGCKNTKILKGIKGIDAYAFSGCAGLRNISIPNTVTYIGASAFEGTGITNLTIPDSVTKIEEAAFMNCKELNFVKLPKNINKIDYETFANCTNLQNVVIPKSVKDIEVTAFCKQTYSDGVLEENDRVILSGVSFWYYGSKSSWNSIYFSKYTFSVDDEYDDEGSFYYDTADKSWVNAYTSKAHFNYKEHEHKWNNKFSKQPTFKAEGIKSCTCSTCKMKFTNVPCNKLVSPTVSKLKAGKKQFTANWKKAPTVAGYQIQYATNAKFKKAKKVTVKKAGTIKKTFKKLKSRKKYYVRVRAYKTINGKKVYSPWSKSKTVKTK